MIITFDQVGTNRNVDNTVGVTSHSNTSKTVETERSDFQLGIADKVMDNEVYGSHGKTMEAVMQQAQLQDVTVQKNFMTVMSNSVSGEDLKEMQEKGYSAGSTDVDTYIDIVDKIKVTLAQAGVIIAGYNDDLSQDKVASITGSVGEAKELTDSFANHQVALTEDNVKDAVNAIMKAMKLQGLSDGMVQYMINNQIEPTIENLYVTQFSATQDSHQAQGYFSDGTGYYARKAQQFNWNQLSGQIKQVCDEAGVDMENPEELNMAMENGRWLIEQGIPLTADNLSQVMVLKQIEMPMPFDKLADLVASSLENGKTAQETNLSGEENILQKAEEIVEDVLSITPEAVDFVLEEGKKINIKNLSEAQKQIVREGKDESVRNQNTDSEPNETSDYQAIKAKRQLLEIQLMMTTENNVKLLKSGYPIETKELEKLVNDLKVMEANEKAILFKGENAEINDEKAQLFIETIDKVNHMSSMPAAVVGRAIATGEKFTINYVSEEGNALKSKYQEAGQSYEALMTAPRKDMGDSIQKAFRNVDDILKNMNLETTEQNRRAVRILSYNQMEITEENITSVKSADLAVQNVMKKMTPGATLQVIRDGVNPLEKSIQEMDDYLTKQNQSHEKQAEKYAEFLFKLEQKNEITPQEREAYIGVYRLFRQIEKSDGAVIGSLVGQQAELNMKNLLSAVRSNKAKGIDVNVNDEFGTLQGLVQEGTKISEQIMGGFSESNQQQQTEQQRQQIDYYNHLCKSVFEDISPEKLEGSGLIDGSAIENMNLEALAEKMSETEEQASESYYESILEECKQLSSIDEAVVQTLMDYEQPVTMDNLLAANTVIQKRGILFRNLANLCEDAKTDSTLNDSEIAENYQDAVDTIVEHFTGKEDAQSAYMHMIQAAEELVDEAVLQGEATAIDVKAASLLYKQMNYISKVAKEENYEIPIEIDGEITSVNLRIIHDSSDKGKISLTMNTEEYGQIGAEFDVTQDKIQGFMVCDRKDSVGFLQEMKETLQDELSSEGEQDVQIQVITTNTLDIQKFSDNQINKKQEDSEENRVSTGMLYRISMKFLQSMRKVV